MKLRRPALFRPAVSCLMSAGALSAQAPAPLGRPPQSGVVVVPGPPAPPEDVPADIVFRSGHAARAAAFECSPEGSLLALAGVDRTFLLSDCGTGLEVRSLPRAAGARSIAFTPEGKRFAAGSPALAVCDAAASAKLRASRGAADVLTSPVFSPDGRLLAGNGRGIVSVWDVATGAERRRWGEHAWTAPGSLAFRPGGRRFAAGGATARVRICDPVSEGPLLTLPMAGVARVLACSADGALFAAGSGAALAVGQEPDGKARLEPVAGQGASPAV